MTAARKREVWAQLDRVTDPELDEPVTDLGFISKVAVEGDDVAIRFRLPTYWCAANFAYLMADDMRREIATLPWVGAIRIELGEHMYAETINRGVLEGRSFDGAFGGAASGSIEAVRRRFLGKSFQRRQERVLHLLRQTGQTDAAVLALTVRDLRTLDVDREMATAIARYLARRGIPGPFAEGSPAFVSLEGEALTADGLGAYRRMLRNVTVNIEFNGALCRGLLAARFEEEQEQGPGLRHFVREAARDRLASRRAPLLGAPP